MPRLPDPDFNKWGQGTSLLGGWFPTGVEILTIIILIVAIGWRARRWRLVWVPVSAAIGVIAALAARTYMNSEGLASDPAPFKLWVWTAVCASSVAVAALGFREARWWRRGLSLVAIVPTLVCALIVLDQVGGLLPNAPESLGRLDRRPASRSDRRQRSSGTAQHAPRYGQAGTDRYPRRRERI
jgi:hypothetical protein